MNIFSSLFGIKKVNGKDLLDEAIEKIIYLADALNSFPAIVDHMKRSGQVFTNGADDTIMANCFLPFGETALKDGDFANRILADLKRGAIDISSLVEAEFIMLLAASNYLLTAYDLADEIASEPEQMAAIRSLYSNPTDPRRETADQIVAFANLAQSVKTAKLMPTSDYLERLASVLCPQLPEQLYQGGVNTFASLRAKEKQ